MKIVLATHNEGKAIEMRALLAVPGIDFVTAGELNLPDVEETGTTFAENAVLKAAAASKESGLPAVADDSGMEITILKGWPGIHSARCAGEGASDEERRTCVLERMAGFEMRDARFVSVMALCRPQNLPTWFSGICSGFLLKEPEGDPKPGLPYDSIFFSPELRMTFAAASEEEKASVSHRGRSAAQMRQYLERLAARMRR